MLLERRIDFQEAVVDRPGVGVKDHLDHAIAFIHRVKQGAKILLTLPKRLLGLLAFSNVPHDALNSPVRKSAPGNLANKSRSILAAESPLAVNYLTTCEPGQFRLKAAPFVRLKHVDERAGENFLTAVLQ